MHPRHIRIPISACHSSTSAQSIDMQAMAQSAERWKMPRHSFFMSFFFLMMLLLHTHCALAAGTSPTSSPNSTTTAATPPATTTAAAPPPAAAVPPPPVSAAPPPTVSATPPTIPIAPPPKATPAAPPPASTPPPVAAAATPPATPPTAATTPPPKANSTNHTAPPPAATPPPKAAHAPAPIASSPPPATAPASAPAPASTPILDPSQVDALSELKVNFSASNPCKTSSDILLCDNTGPPHHLISLSLKDCPSTAILTTEALVNLSTLQSLEFVNCSLAPAHVPQVLVKSLTTFICSASLGKTSMNQKLAKLSGVWLSTLKDLQELSVTDVEVSVSGLTTIVKDMKDLTQLMVSRVNMPGVLPKNTWPSGLTDIDLSGNSIRGTLPSQMRSLAQLKRLDLSDNQIKGVLPNIFGDLSQLQYIDLSQNQFSGAIPGSLAFLRNCSHLDLSNNLLNGTIPANLTSIKTLRYLDLSRNDLTGAIPFNSTFLNRLTTLKLDNNAGLCYNHTALKSKFLTGIPNCVSVADDTAVLAPAPAPAASDLSAGSKSGHISKGAAAGISIVVIVAAAAIVFGVSKWWRSRRDDGDQFENLRAPRERP